MKRAALIIGASGGDLPGVEKDVKNYRDFLLSPLGGAWNQTEIVTLSSPSRLELDAKIDVLGQASYSMVFFAGHGFHSSDDDSTIIQLRPGEIVHSATMRRGAAKHTLVLDCCRELSKSLITEEVFAKAAKRELVLDAAQCRHYYDKRIEDCASGLVVMFACAIDETAGEDPQVGGYYSTSLLRAAQTWKDSKDIDLSEKYSVLSVTQAHDAAVPSVKRLSAGRQSPAIEYPRTTLRFPFAVVA